MAGKSAKQIVTKPKRRAPRTAWKPGVSANPHGRPKNEFCLTYLLRKFGEEEHQLRMRTLVKRVWDEACRGEEWAAKLIWERTEGKVVQPLQVENKNVTIGTLPPGIALSDL
jgi:hypothetical protein